MLHFKVINGQELVLVGKEKISAGTNDIYAKFEYGEDFTGTIKAYFSTDPSSSPVAKILGADGTCLIPEEVLSVSAQSSGIYDHWIYISLADAGRTTTSVCRVPVEKTIYSENPVNPGTPTQSILDQIISENNEFKEDVEEDIENFETTVNNANTSFQNSINSTVSGFEEDVLMKMYALHGFKIITRQRRSVVAGSSVTAQDYAHSIQVNIAEGEKFVVILIDENDCIARGMNIYSFDANHERHAYTPSGGSIVKNNCTEYTAPFDITAITETMSAGNVIGTGNIEIVIAVPGKFVSETDKAIHDATLYSAKSSVSPSFSNGWINGVTGQLNIEDVEGEYKFTSKIGVTGKIKVTFSQLYSGASAGYAFYTAAPSRTDYASKFISGGVLGEGTEGDEITVNVPGNAKYLIVSCKTNSTDDFVSYFPEITLIEKIEDLEAKIQLLS